MTLEYQSFIFSRKLTISLDFYILAVLLSLLAKAGVVSIDLICSQIVRFRTMENIGQYNAFYL